VLDGGQGFCGVGRVVGGALVALDVGGALVALAVGGTIGTQFIGGSIGYIGAGTGTTTADKYVAYR